MNARITPTPNELRSLLRGVGLRVTQPRLRVLREIAVARTPISHKDVARLEPHPVDRATVHRNLADFSSAGLVRRGDFGDHVWRYELVRAGDGDRRISAHFLCATCGSSWQLPNVAVALWPIENAPRALMQRTVAVQVQGICDACC